MTALPGTSDIDLLGYGKGVVDFDTKIAHSGTRHTAREHTTEAKVHYPYHPQFGEAVIVRGRLVTHNVEMAVILQPDGSLACLPAWMLAESAAQHGICQIPNDFNCISAVSACRTAAQVVGLTAA
jgi:hypothetical protein